MRLRVVPAIGVTRRLLCGGVAVRGSVVVAVLACFVLGVSGGPTAGFANGNSDWPAYLMDAGHSSYNAAATAIGRGDAGDVNPVWQWQDPPRANGGNAFLIATPVVVNGVVYEGDEDGRFFAIRESDQAVLWSRFLGVVRKTSCFGGGLASTATVTTDPDTGARTVYVFGTDGNMYALDAATGDTVWQTTIDTPSTTANDYYSWSSPLVVNGKVYVGIASACDVPLVPAGVTAVDQATGAMVASWHDLPAGQIGASVWSTVGALPDGSIVVTTGNAANTHTTAQPLYGESVVRLDGSDLSVLDAWQLPVSQRIPDSDFGGSPTAFTATINGTPTPMFGACNKNGVYYAFRQSDLHDGPVWQTQVAAPYQTTPGDGQCDGAAIWDGTRLIVPGGNDTTIDGVAYQGSVRSLNPATGAVLWAAGLPGQIIGTPTEDGLGLVAAQVYNSRTSDYGVYLIDASNGAVVGHISDGVSDIFAQPVFAGNDVLVAGQGLLTAYEVTTPGPPITQVNPASIGAGGATLTLTLTGSGFTGKPRIFVSGAGVLATNLHVVNSTTMTVSLRATPVAAPGKRDITLIMPGPTADTCVACLNIGAKTTTAVGSSEDPSMYGDAVTLTATVSPTDSGGSVAFSASGVAIAGCKARPLVQQGSGGQATCTTSVLMPGQNTVTATYSGDAGYGASSGTLAGGQTVNSPPVNSGVPTVAGTATQGQTLSGTLGTWGGNLPITYTRSWLRCDISGLNCSAIPNAAGVTYKLQRADVGFTIEFRTAATNNYGGPVSATSLPTSVVQGLPPSNTALPTVSGNAIQGETLSGALGSWTGYGPFVYTKAWLRCDMLGQNCSLIPKDTSGRYTLRAADVGFTIEFQVTASNGYGSSSVTSLPTTVVDEPGWFARCECLAVQAGQTRWAPRLCRAVITGYTRDEPLTVINGSGDVQRQVQSIHRSDGADENRIPGGPQSSAWVDCCASLGRPSTSANQGRSA
jgi:outer membrane protein assembly factor BamB